MNVSRFTIPRQVEDDRFSILVLDSGAQSYQLLRNDKLVLEGQAGELVKKDGVELFVTDLNAKDGFEFSIRKRSPLDAIDWLKQNLSVSERGKQTGILELSFTGENRGEITGILNDIAQNYFLQNVERKSAEAEKSLAFLKDNLPNVKHSLTEAEDTLNAFRQKNDSIDLGLEAQSILKVMVELNS